MKMTKENIRYIDKWLQFAGIQYLDVRYELIDHLVSEFEELEEKTNLKDFVKCRLDWCKATAKKKDSTMHWSIQKSLWKRFFALCINVKFILPILLYLGLAISMSAQFSEKIIKLFLFAPVFITIAAFLYLFAFKGFGWKLQEKVLSINKLATLVALPQIFLSFFAFPDFWKVSTDFLAPAVVLMTLMNIAAIIEYRNLYKKISKEYEFLKKELV